MMKVKIFYDKMEKSFTLSKFETVETLKEYISNEFRLPLDEVHLEGWVKPPRDDDDMLALCCFHENDSFMEESILNLFRNSNPEQFRNYPAYVIDFSTYFNTSGLNFLTCEIEDALAMVMNTDLDKRKVLIIFLCNKNDKFAKLFTEFIAKPDIKELLNEEFFFMGCNLENDTYHSALIETLEVGLQKDLSHIVKKKISSALFIVPIENTVSISTCVHGDKVKESDLRTTVTNVSQDLKEKSNVEVSLKLANKKADQPTLDSTSFLQLMCDKFGDRDYDNFDEDELDKLSEKIAYSLFGPPSTTDGYEEANNKVVKQIYDVILRESNLISAHKNRVIVSFIFICIEPLPDEKMKRLKKDPENYVPSADFTPKPVFILRKCEDSTNPCRVIIDDTLRVYSSWQGFIKDNRFPPCLIVMPSNGRYETDENGKLKLETWLSPSSGLDTKVFKALDVGGTIAGIASGGVFVAAAIPTIAVAPIPLTVAGAVGLGVGVYSLGRSIYRLVDRGTHKESMSLRNSEARGCYINIAAGAIGFVGAWANVTVSQFAARGTNIAQGFTTTVNIINVSNIAVSGIGVGNSTYDVIDNWVNNNDKPSLLTMVQLGSSILFFGHAVYSFRNAATIIEESHARAFKDIESSLRSNRHRKMFDKLTKETIARNNGDVIKGRTEVIKTIRNIKNKDDVFATLARSNKEMNRNKVRFASKNGNIELNGVPIDLNQFTSMNKAEMTTFLQGHENVQISADSSTVQAIKSKLEQPLAQNLATNYNMWADAQTVAVLIAKIAMGDYVRDMITNTVADFINYIKGDDHSDLWTLFSSIHPEINYMIQSMIEYFYQQYINQIEELYTSWKKNGECDDSSWARYFPEFPQDFEERASHIFRVICKMHCVMKQPKQVFIKQIVEFAYTWISREICDYQEKKERERKRVPIDLNQFTSMNKAEMTTFLQGHENVQISADSAAVQTIKSKLEQPLAQNWAANYNMWAGAQTVAVLIAKIAMGDDVRDMITNTVSDVINYITGDDHSDLWTLFSSIHPEINNYMKVFTMIEYFYQQYINQIEEMYTSWKKNGECDDSSWARYFPEFPQDFEERTSHIFRAICEKHYVMKQPKPVFIKQIVEFAYTWISREYYDYQEEKERERKRVKSGLEKSKCSVCDGVYYKKANRPFFKNLNDKNLSKIH